MTNSRVSRGRQTQQLLAAWFHRKGWATAASVAAFLPGSDVVGVPGWAIEVKATSKGDLLAALRQAANNAHDCQTPVVVWRPNGYGEARQGEWIVAMTLNDFTTIAQQLRGIKG